MPRYFFHIHDGRDHPDEEGTELVSPEEARNQAVIACGEMLKDLGAEFWGSGKWTMAVKNWQGAVVCELKVSSSR